MTRSSIRLEKRHLDEFVKWLRAAGFETQLDHARLIPPGGPKHLHPRSDYRVLMWRKEVGPWSQAYDGYTSGAKVGRYWLRCFGPDEEAVRSFLRETGKEELTFD